MKVSSKINKQFCYKSKMNGDHCIFFKQNPLMSPTILEEICIYILGNCDKTGGTNELE